MLESVNIDLINHTFKLEIIRHRGLMDRALACGVDGLQVEITFDRVSGKPSYVHPSANRYSTFFRVGEGLGGEGRGDGHRPLHAEPSDTC